MSSDRTKLQIVFFSYELNGQDCIITSLCDAKQYLIPGKSLVEDVLHVLFR